MTIQLTQALKEAEKLSPELQNEIAEQLLDDIQSELQWQKTLSQPQPALDMLAQKALDDSVNGKTHKAGFDEV
jgi:hypothetical protein